MGKYILRRFLTIPVILLVLSCLVFSLVMFLSPYERLAVFVPSPEAMEGLPLDDLIKRYGLDQPFYIQYFNWLKGALTGQLGWSPSARMPVAEALKLRIPATLELMLFGQIIIFFGGIILGTYTAVHHNKLQDQLVRLFTILGVSLPGFVIGLALLVIFYAWLGILPPGRLSIWAEDVVYLSNNYQVYTGMNLIDSLLNRRLDIFVDALRHIILPSIAYSIGTLSVTVRLMRSSLLETIRQDYVNTARSKGLPEKVVINKHARRNAMLPIITFMGARVPVMFGGAVIVETVFSYPGMGTLIVTAAQGLDFPTILGATLFIGLIIILCNLLVDILYGILDPRISLE